MRKQPGSRQHILLHDPSCTMSTETERCYRIVEDDLDMQLLIQLKFKADSRLRFSGAATNLTKAIELAQGANNGVLILDHFIEGKIMGLQAAPLIKAVVPDIKIILFTSHDLTVEASREPAIDAYLRKSNLAKLLPTALRLLGLKPLTN